MTEENTFSCYMKITPKIYRFLLYDRNYSDTTFHEILTQIYELGTIIDSILHMIKLRHEEVNLPKISDGDRTQM